MRAVAFRDCRAPVSFESRLLFGREWTRWTGLNRLDRRNRSAFRLQANSIVNDLSVVHHAAHHGIGVGGVNEYHSCNIGGKLASKDASQWSACTRADQYVRTLHASAR